MLTGLFGFAGFFLVLATCLEDWGLVAAFAAAIALTLAVQGVAFWTLKRGQARARTVVGSGDGGRARRGGERYLATLKRKWQISPSRTR